MGAPRDDASEPAASDASPSIDASDAAPPRDEALDVLEVSSDTPAIDAREADDGSPADGSIEASLDASSDGSAVSYRVDRASVLVSPTIGTGVLLPPGVGNHREAECAEGLIGGISVEDTPDREAPVWVNRVQFLCQGLRADGRISPPSSYLSAINETPAGVTMPVGLERCPDGFALVGLRGEESYVSGSRYWWINRVGTICARVSEWASLTETAPTEATEIFARERVATEADGGAETDASDGATAVGSDALAALRPCTTAGAGGACVHPIHGGRPVATSSGPVTMRRAFFATCPGGYVPFGYSGTAGYYLERLELRCARLRVSR